MQKKNKGDLTDLLRDGATIIDVRSKREFAAGNVFNSINIPLPLLENDVEMLKLKQPIVLCCASGMRSSMAVTALKKIGVSKVYNGGSWEKLESQITK